MQNQSTSARTAAKYSSKCSLLFRQAPILAILMLAAVFSAQSQNISYGIKSLFDNNTGTSSIAIGTSANKKSVNSIQLGRKQDTIKVMILLSDTTATKNTNKNVVNEWRYDYSMVWRFGYSVREIYNEGENSIDWYHSHQNPPKDYFVHSFYLDINKERFASTVIAWQSVPAK
jgi:hypothetical protein